jgi:predicted methyltransferase
MKSGGHLVLIDFKRIEGKTKKWTMDHVRAGKEVFQAEIEAAGFSLVAEEQIDGLQENYFLRFRKD